MRRMATRKQARELINQGALKQSLHPLKCGYWKKCYVCGFDTEYEGARLYSYQVSHAGQALYVRTDRLTCHDLYDALVSIIPDYDPKVPIYACSWWNDAELSHMNNVLDDAYRMSASSGRSWKYCWVHPDDQDTVMVGDVPRKCARKGARKLFIYDISVHFRASLKAVAPIFGLEKLDWDFDEIPTGQAVDLPGFREYAENDAIITEGIAVGYRTQAWETLGLDIMIFNTPAKLGMGDYRKNWLECGVDQRNTDLRYASLRCAHGARSEAYATYREHVREYDFPGLYPNCAVAIGRLPRGEDWEPVRRGQYRYDRTVLGGLVLAEFEIPEGRLCPIGVETAREGWVWPRTGLQWTTTYECDQALAVGGSVWVHDGWVFRDGVRSFSEFCAHHLERKDHYDKASKACNGSGVQAQVLRTLHKNIGNHTIGKLYNYKGGLDLDRVRELAAANVCSVQDILSASKFVDLSGTVHAISALAINVNKTSWMPEWHALIIGKARAELFRVARQAQGLVMLSTDSVICQSLAHDEDTDVPWVEDKSQEDMCCYATRTKSYILFPDDAEAALHRGDAAAWSEGNCQRWKCAHHGIHMTTQQAFQYILGRFRTLTPMSGEVLTGYTSKPKIGTLIQGMRSKDIAWGVSYTRAMLMYWGWDQKRFLDPGDVSEPWHSAESYKHARAVLRVQKRQLRRALALQARDDRDFIPRDVMSYHHWQTRRRHIIDEMMAGDEQLYDDALTTEENAMRTLVLNIVHCRDGY